MIVDLTNCRDSITGELDAIAVKTVADFCSYSEIAPSGTGVRTIVCSKSRSFEVFWWSQYNDTFEDYFYLWPWVFHYDWFLPITGQGLPDVPPKIQERDEELKRLEQFDDERPSLLHPPSTKSTALINGCRIVDQAVVVNVNPGVDVCLDVMTGERIHNVVTPPIPAHPGSEIVTASGIRVQPDGYIEIGPCCISATDWLTGDELWLWCFPDDVDHVSRLADYDAIGCTVELGSGVVFVQVDNFDDCELFALDERSGRELWHFFDSRVLSLRYADGIAYVRASDGLYALDAIDGRELWRLDIQLDERTSHNKVSDSQLYEIDAQSKLHAVHPVTGDLHWECALPSGAELITEKDGLITFRTSSSLGAIDAQTGVIRWEVEGGFRMVAGQTVYAGDDDSSVVALESASGHERWHFRIGDPVRFLRVVDDVVLVAGQHVLHALRHV